MSATKSTDDASFPIDFLDGDTFDGSLAPATRNPSTTASFEQAVAETGPDAPQNLNVNIDDAVAPNFMWDSDETQRSSSSRSISVYPAFVMGSTPPIALAVHEVVLVNGEQALVEECADPFGGRIEFTLLNGIGEKFLHSFAMAEMVSVVAASLDTYTFLGFLEDTPGTARFRSNVSGALKFYEVMPGCFFADLLEAIDPNHHCRATVRIAETTDRHWVLGYILEKTICAALLEVFPN